MDRQNIGKAYGDPGWVRKINNWKQSNNRDAQLEFRIPVLLGKYSDVSSTYFNAADYETLLFGDNETGSMREYYHEISYGNFSVDGDAGGWYNSSFTMQQAVDNTREYVSNVASLADGDFDYGLYDNDGPDNIPNSPLSQSTTSPNVIGTSSVMVKLPSISPENPLPVFLAHLCGGSDFAETPTF